MKPFPIQAHYTIPLKLLDVADRILTMQAVVSLVAVDMDQAESESVAYEVVDPFLSLPLASMVGEYKDQTRMAKLQMYQKHLVLVSLVAAHMDQKKWEWLEGEHTAQLYQVSLEASHKDLMVPVSLEVEHMDQMVPVSLADVHMGLMRQEASEVEHMNQLVLV